MFLVFRFSTLVVEGDSLSFIKVVKPLKPMVLGRKLPIRLPIGSIGVTFQGANWLLNFGRLPSCRLKKKWMGKIDTRRGKMEVEDDQKNLG